MFKKLKGLFIEEDEETDKKSEKEALPLEKQETKTTEQNTTPSYVPPAGNAKASPKFLEVLLGAMEKNNLEGFDYLEFKQALKSLSKLPMDEEMRYKSAYASAQTMGATPAQLVKAAHHYIKVLRQEDAKFQQALKTQMTKQVGNKEQQLKDLEAMIRNKEKQIKQLTQQIEKHKKEMSKMREEITNSTVKVEATKNSFLASFNSVVGQIQTDIQNMEKYLK